MKVADQKDVGIVEPELTNTEFWDEFWQPRLPAANEPRLLDRVKNALKTLLGEHTIRVDSAALPNFRGLPYVLARIFDRETLRSHNLEIMRKPAFSMAFRPLDPQPAFCGYYGVCDLSVPISGPTAKRGGYTVAYHDY